MRILKQISDFMIVNEMLWVTHPAYSLDDSLPDRKSRDATEIQEFLDERIMPLAKKIVEKPDSVAVLVKTDNRLKDARNDSERMRQIVLQATEKRIERELKKLFGTRRLIVIGNEHFKSPSEVTREINIQLKKRDLKVNRHTRVIACGSYRKQCARDYGREFALKRRTHFKESKEHTLPIKRKRTGKQ